MGRRPYLLTVEETSGYHTFETNHLIEAEDEQMVKYHYHRTLKDGMYSDSLVGGDKHRLEAYDAGIGANIREIRPVSGQEERILRKFIGNWPKV